MTTRPELMKARGGHTRRTCTAKGHVQDLHRCDALPAARIFIRILLEEVGPMAATLSILAAMIT
jgi:hypothetical protein